MAEHSKAIRAVLHKYTVRKHYRATSQGTGTQYAVFVDGVQSGEPKSHASAQQDREDMIVRDLIEMMGGGDA